MIVATNVTYSGLKAAEKKDGCQDGDQKMIDEKLAEKIGPSVEERMLSTLELIEQHMKTLVFHSTPERAFISSAGKAITAPDREEEPISEIIKQEIEKHLKENK